MKAGSSSVTAIIRHAVTSAWRLPSGPTNTVVDVAGVRLGHATLYDPDQGICTGVTALHPAPDVLAAPLTAAVHVINGYGKSVGLMQIEELGELETPILLTGVFNVARVHAALVDWLLRADPTLGDAPTGRSVNAVVLECNDGYMNDPRVGRIGPESVEAALAEATAGVTGEAASGAADGTGEAASGAAGEGMAGAGATVRLGTVGAGIGMSTFGYAGAIGSASRRWPLPEGGDATVGVLVLSNYGRAEDLVIAGRPMGSAEPSDGRSLAGSCIIVIATDLPLAQAQLKRVARRAQNGIARTGGITASGSGEVVVAFTTSRRPPLRPDRGQDQLDLVFRAVGEAVEEAVLAGLLSASDVRGREGRSQRAFPAERLAVLAEATSAHPPSGRRDDAGKESR